MSKSNKTIQLLKEIKQKGGWSYLKVIVNVEHNLYPRQFVSYTVILKNLKIS